MLSGPYPAVIATTSVPTAATARAASRILAVIEAVVLGLTRSSFIAHMASPDYAQSSACAPGSMEARAQALRNPVIPAKAGIHFN